MAKTTDKQKDKIYYQKRNRRNEEYDEKRVQYQRSVGFKDNEPDFSKSFGPKGKGKTPVKKKNPRKAPKKPSKPRAADTSGIKKIGKY